jgi:prepilin-type N-terminal cleavage/methylation domain-containing protein
MEMHRRGRAPGNAGFTLVDMLATIAIIGTMAAIAAPQMIDGVDRMRLGMSARDVERELQFARLKSVSTNRPMRVRLNCPVATQFRVVELIGTPRNPTGADSAANRCDESVYPYRPTGGDQNRLTRTNNDGALRRLHPQATFTAFPTLEFWPDGSVHIDAGVGNPWPPLTAAGATITLSRKGKTRNISVNALGKIKLQ